MKIPGSDGRSYDVTPAGEGDDYEIKLKGQLIGGFRLEPASTPTWIADGARGTVTNAVLEKVANEFVERGGAQMRMA